jgi:hypothetical protein
MFNWTKRCPFPVLRMCKSRYRSRPPRALGSRLSSKKWKQQTIGFGQSMVFTRLWKSAVTRDERISSEATNKTLNEQVLSDVKDADKNWHSDRKKIPWCTVCNMTSQYKMTSLCIVSYALNQQGNITIIYTI